MAAPARPAALTDVRLSRDARREALLEAAADLLREGSIDAVTMEAVAERAGVSRPLVYKHFSNRDELLATVYRREAAQLHDEMARSVQATDSVEGMFRVLIRAALRATVERGPLLSSLRGAGSWSREVAREQRERDAITARAFTQRAVERLDLEPRPAAAAIGLLLSLIDPVLTQFRTKPTSRRAAVLEDTYMTIVTATLDALPRAP